MPDDTPATIARIRADLDRLADLLARLRLYLGDGHAGAPVAAAFVEEIDAALGMEKN